MQKSKSWISLSWPSQEPIKIGLLFRLGSFWIGGHYSKEHKRLCINLVPFVTLWVVWPGGDVP